MEAPFKEDNGQGQYADCAYDRSVERDQQRASLREATGEL